MCLFDIFVWIQYVIEKISQWNLRCSLQELVIFVLNGEVLAAYICLIIREFKKISEINSHHVRNSYCEVSTSSLPRIHRNKSNRSSGMMNCSWCTITEHKRRWRIINCLSKYARARSYLLRASLFDLRERGVKGVLDQYQIWIAKKYRFGTTGVVKVEQHFTGLQREDTWKLAKCFWKLIRISSKP